jgi:cysteine desulfurase
VTSIYLDHNATTPVRPEVAEAMLPFLVERYGNPSSIHAHGAQARTAVDRSRAEIAAFIRADAREIFLTSGGTESDNLAIIGAARAASRGMAPHVVVTRVEHHAVMSAAAALEREGIRVTRLPVGRDGRVDPGALRAAVGPDTVLVSVIWANNETGVLQDIPPLAAIAHETGALFHADAVQVAGKVPIDVRGSGVDLLSLSAHKFYGPKGAGALYVRRGVRLQPIIHGGGQETGLRSGTPNVPGVVGMGAACRLLGEELDDYRRLLSRLTGAFEAELRRRFPEVWIHGAGADRVPGTTCFTIPGTQAETFLIGLDLEGFCVSSGSACTTGSLQPSHVLLAMGVPREVAAGAIRVSFGRENTGDHVHRLLGALDGLVARFRSLARGGERTAKRNP